MDLARQEVKDNDINNEGQVDLEEFNTPKDEDPVELEESNTPKVIEELNTPKVIEPEVLERIIIKKEPEVLKRR